MFTTFLKNWIWAGISRNKCQYVSPARLTNLIALLLFLVLLSHLPLHFLYWFEGGSVEAMLLILHSLLCPLVPCLSSLGRHRLARRLLIGIFASFITLTSLYLGHGSSTELFLVQGFFISPFLFSSEEQRYLWTTMLIYAGLFVLLNFLQLDLFVPAGSAYQLVAKQVSVVSFTLACLVCVYHIHRDHTSSWRQLAKEQQKSENLLLNILPSSIAERLKRSDKPVADYFSNATVLFADIEDFCDITNQRRPQDLVLYLNDLFSEFDLLLKQYRLEKIKTNGDEYMAVAGVPIPFEDHAERACLCALEIQRLFKQIGQRHGISKGLRVGLNSGELVAGVIGKDKYSYDLWGDNVNLASRMESQGLSQRIQVTESTYRLCRHRFHFEERGELEVPGMGKIHTYWLLNEKNQAENSAA